MRKTIRTASLALMLVLLGHLLGMATAWLIISRSGPEAISLDLNPPARKMTLFWQVWDIVQADYIGQIPDFDTVMYGAIRGALNTLGDPYTVFVEPQARQREMESLQGKFGGIGVTMQRDPDGNVLLNPLPESPALKAGVLEGDVLVAAAGQAITESVSFDAIIALVRGPVETPVTIEIRRGAPPVFHSFIIVRQEIELPSAAWRLIEGEPEIGYIALARFSGRSSQEVERAIAELRAQGATRLILDLRDNGGGLRQAGIEIASQFVPDGVVMYQRQKNKSEETFTVIKGAGVVDWPLVVLVNAGTASASEIVAGALQDHERAIVIGEPTFGKGSVQHIYDLSGGSSLHVTAAEWLTPERHRLSGQGLTPDILVARAPKDAAGGHDAQLAAAIDHLKRNR